MSGDICTDNRFELIEKCKQKLIEATNISTNLDEMAVIDSILFRFWQMGWLDRLEQPKPKWIPCVDGNEPKANAECWISTNAKFVRRASYAPKANNQPNGFIVTDGSFGFYKYGETAKAWMPYTKEPEPYREEGD